MAHVEALDAQGRVGQAERVLEGVEGPGPGVVVGRPPQPVADELLLGVLGDRGLQRPLVAPLGTRTSTREPRSPDSHRSYRSQSSGSSGTSTSRGMASGVGLGVHLLEHLAHQLGRA